MTATARREERASELRGHYGVKTTLSNAEAASGAGLVVIAIKEGLFQRMHRVGRRISSAAVHTDAWHHRTDAVTSAAAAVGIAVSIIGGKGYEVADDWLMMT